MINQSTARHAALGAALLAALALGAGAPAPAASTTISPTPAPTLSTLDSNAILSVLIATTAAHCLNEFGGVDTGGYMTGQLVIALATRPCASKNMQGSFAEALAIVNPAGFWQSEGDAVTLIAPATVLVCSIALHGFLTLFIAFVLALMPDDDDRSDSDDEGTGTAADNRSPSDTADTMSVVTRATRLTRWPFWSASLLRMNLVPCIMYAARQLSLGQNLPNGSSPDAATSGVVAAGIIASVAIVIVMVASLAGIQRFSEVMGPKWLWYGGSGNIANRRRDALPCVNILLADGYWSDKGDASCSAAIAAANPSVRAVVAINLWLPLVFFALAAVVGVSWDRTSAICGTPFITVFAVLLATAVAPVVVVRPYRHTFVNAMAVFRYVSVMFVALSQFGDDTLRDGIQSVSVGVFLAVELIAAVSVLVLAVLERVLWRPAEGMLRTYRLQYLLLIHAAAEQLRRDRGGGSEQAIAQAAAAMSSDELAALVPERTLATIRRTTFKETLATSEAFIFGPSSQQARALTAPLLTVPTFEGAEELRPMSRPAAESALPPDVEPASPVNPLSNRSLSLNGSGKDEGRLRSSGSSLVFRRVASPTESRPRAPDPFASFDSLVPPAMLRDNRRADPRNVSADATAVDPRGTSPFALPARQYDPSSHPSPSPLPPARRQQHQQYDDMLLNSDEQHDSVFQELDMITAAIANFPTIPWTQSFTIPSNGGGGAERPVSSPRSQRRIRFFDDDPSL